MSIFKFLLRPDMSEPLTYLLSVTETSDKSDCPYICRRARAWSRQGGGSPAAGMAPPPVPGLGPGDQGRRVPPGEARRGKDGTGRRPPEGRPTRGESWPATQAGREKADWRPGPAGRRPASGRPAAEDRRARKEAAACACSASIPCSTTRRRRLSSTAWWLRPP